MKLINKEDKIFVAGHNGMVGSSVVRNLKLKGYKNIITSSKEKLDLRDQNQVKKWFFKNSPEIVILAAAKVGGIFANNSFPTEFLLDNLKIQNNVIESSWQTKVKRLLFLGSSCIYPKYSEQPIKEESLLSGSLEPTNESYALAKISGIKLCQSLRQQYNFDAISLMPTNLYGTGDNYHPMNSHVMPALIRKFHEAKISNSEEVVCWGSGNPMREFLHVDDLGKACIFALETWDPDTKNAPKDKIGNILTYLNVGTGKDISIKNLAFLISEIIGFNGRISWDKDKPDGTPKKLLDISQIENLGWKPNLNIRDGIAMTIKEFQNLAVKEKI
tara:strand:+ start:1338 stop:2327 length:990 start_codon:yes stop_codon:yes gene_type:complete